MNLTHVLKQVLLTEKSNKLSSELGQYTFEVHMDSTKYTVKHAVEAAFKVSVTRVNIMNIGGKNKRTRKGGATTTSDYKKAIVTLKKGDKIELI